MKNIRFSFLLAALVCFLPGIVSAQQAPAASSATGDATVYIYRFRDAYAMLLKPSVYCDGRQLLRMRNGRYGKFTIPAGTHIITSTYEGNGVSMKFDA